MKFPTYRVESRNPDTGFWELSHSCPLSPKLSEKDGSLNARVRAIALAKAAFEPKPARKSLFAGFTQNAVRTPLIDIRVVETTVASDGGSTAAGDRVIWKNGEWAD